MKQTPKNMHQNIQNWYKTHGRHDLPWRTTSDPYHIYLSEVMYSKFEKNFGIIIGQRTCIEQCRHCLQNDNHEALPHELFMLKKG